MNMLNTTVNTPITVLSNDVNSVNSINVFNDAVSDIMRDTSQGVDMDFLSDFEDIFGEESSQDSDSYVDYYEATKDIDNSHMYWNANSPKTLEELVVNIVNSHFKIIGDDKTITIEEYSKLLDRGMKPTKALFKLGVEQQVAGILGTLKLSSSAEDIQAVYNDETIKSCMSLGGQLYNEARDIGSFYNSVGISLLHNDRYRILIDLERNWMSSRGYGVLCYKIDELLSGVVSKYDLELYSYKFKAVPSIVTNFHGQTVFHTEISNGSLPYLDNISIERGVQPVVSDLQQKVLTTNTWIRDMNTYNDMFDINSNELVWNDYDSIICQYNASLDIMEKGTFIGYANLSLKCPVYEYGDKYYTIDLINGQTRFDLVPDSEILVQYNSPNGDVFIVVQDDLPF